MDENKPGSVCKQCSKGRIALMSTMIGNANLDSEPYTDGVKEGENDTVVLQDYITLSIHACDNCGFVYSSNIED